METLLRKVRKENEDIYRIFILFVMKLKLGETKLLNKLINKDSYTQVHVFASVGVVYNEGTSILKNAL